MAVTLEQAELVGVQLETLVYGIYLIFFPANIYLLLSRQANNQAGRGKVNPILIYGAVLLFILVTGHWLVDQLRLWGAFITNGSVPEGPLIFYALLSDPRNIARTVIFSLEILTLDALLLYRLYVIWDRKFWVLILPTISLIGSTATGVGVCVGFSRAPVGVPVFNLAVSKWITATFTCSIATNILAVAFIAYRIASRDRRLTTSSVTGLSSTLMILVESAFLYCLLNATTMIALIIRSPLQFTFLAVASPITGISFSLITLRVRLSKSLTSRFAPEDTRELRIATDRSMPMRVRVTHDAPIVTVEDKTGSYDRSGPTKIMVERDAISRSRDTDGDSSPVEDSSVQGGYLASAGRRRERDDYAEESWPAAV